MPAAVLPEMGTWSAAEKRVLAIFGLTALAWVTRSAPFGGWSDWLNLPGANDASVALLAVALMTLIRASIATVVIAIAIPEIPRVVRLVRSLVLTIREQPYIEAARATGTRLPMILARHVIPNLLTPLIVQASFIWASAA